MIGSLEELLKYFWSKNKFTPFGWVIFLLIIFVAILLSVALISDIGFGDEVKQYRIPILLFVLFVSALSAIIGWLVYLTKRNNEVYQQNNDLNNKLSLITKESEQKDIAIENLQQTILNLRKEFTKERVFQVLLVQQYKEKIYLKIKKKENQELKRGNEMRIFDNETGSVMGVFEITEVLETEFTAKGKYIDPLWLGHIKNVGSAESSMPPDTIAVLFVNEEYNKNE